ALISQTRSPRAELAMIERAVDYSLAEQTGAGAKRKAERRRADMRASHCFSGDVGRLAGFAERGADTGQLPSHARCRRAEERSEHHTLCRPPARAVARAEH